MRPAAVRLLAQVRRLADHCPVLMLQGTWSHEPPGTLSVFRHAGRPPSGLVADRIGQAGADRAGHGGPSRPTWLLRAACRAGRRQRTVQLHADGQQGGGGRSGRRTGGRRRPRGSSWRGCCRATPDPRRGPCAGRAHARGVARHGVRLRRPSTACRWPASTTSSPRVRCSAPGRRPSCSATSTGISRGRNGRAGQQCIAYAGLHRPLSLRRAGRQGLPGVGRRSRGGALRAGADAGTAHAGHRVRGQARPRRAAIGGRAGAGRRSVRQGAMDGRRRGPARGRSGGNRPSAVGRCGGEARGEDRAGRTQSRAGHLALASLADKVRAWAAATDVNATPLLECLAQSIAAPAQDIVERALRFDESSAESDVDDGRSEDRLVVHPVGAEECNRSH